MEKQAKMVQEIRFYTRNGEYGFLSNFHRAMQEVDGKTYPTNEHYYQSQKAKNWDMQKWIASSPKAYHSMKAGRSLRPNEMVDDWENKKIQVMRNGLKAKFFENEELATALLETGDAILIEDSPSDMFWGGKLEGSQNMLGILLMEIRDSLQHMEQMLANKKIKCEACGKGYPIIGDFATKCSHCGMSIDPDTGKSYGVYTTQFGGIGIRESD